MKKAISPSQLYQKKYNLFDFDNAWLDAFGNPERTGVWFIWGASGSGKTTFALELAKYLSRFDKVLYNSKEEGLAHTMKKAFQRVDMREIGSAVQLLDNEDMEKLDLRLQKRQSRRIIFIDSFQYTGFDFSTFLRFVEKYERTKLLVFISQADGTNPLGQSAVKAMFHASLKIYVEGYKAFSKGRYIGATGEYTIWKEGVEKYWNTIKN